MYRDSYRRAYLINALNFQRSFVRALLKILISKLFIITAKRELWKQIFCRKYLNYSLREKKNVCMYLTFFDGKTPPILNYNNFCIDDYFKISKK